MADPIKQAEQAATQAADAALAQASKYAGQATAGIEVAQHDAQGWLRRNVWGVLGAAVVLAVIVFWFLVR